MLVAEKWFDQHYADFEAVRVSVHATNKATKAAAASASYALTYEKLASLVSDARALFTKLCESQLTAVELVSECARELARTPVQAERLRSTYLVRFVVE